MIIDDPKNKNLEESGMLYTKLSEGSPSWLIDTVDLSKVN